MNKLIFLDVDGVLNSDKWFRSAEYRKRRQQIEGQGKFLLSRSERTEKDKDYYRLVLKQRDIDPDALLELNRVLIATDAKIVVSSTWRIASFTLGALSECGIHDWTGRYIGRTRSSRRDECRGDEIHDWIVDNDYKGKYVILDDDSDMGHLSDRLVQTSWMTGLVTEQGDEIIKRLS